MKRLMVSMLAISLVTGSTAIAADLSIGLRMGHFHPLGGGDWWGDYVSGRNFNLYDYDNGGWTLSGTTGRASSAQNDDFSNLNMLPAIRGILRLDRVDLILFDLEVWDPDEVRIADSAFKSSKRGARYVWSTKEEADLRVISLRNMAAYRFDNAAGHFFLGGGISWNMWEIDTRLSYEEYTATDSMYKRYEVTDTAEYAYQDEGMAVGLALIGGYEYEMSATLHPFVDISYEYAVAEWAPDNLGSDPWNRMPWGPTFDVDSHHDRYYEPKFDIKDSYGANLGGLKVSFGMNVML